VYFCPSHLCKIDVNNTTTFLLTLAFYRLIIKVAFAYKSYTKAKNKHLIQNITPHSTKQKVRLYSQLSNLHLLKRGIHSLFFVASPFSNSQIEPARLADSSFERPSFQFVDRIVQMGVFLMPCAVIDRATATKNAQMGDSDANCGGAAGYCLRVRKIFSYAFYEHSLLFHLGILCRAGINETL